MIGYKKTKDTWLETYWDCIQKGYIYLNDEKVPFIVGDEMRLEVSKLINDLQDERYYYVTKERNR